MLNGKEASQRGFGLIEALIALVVSAVISAAVIRLLAASGQAFSQSKKRAGAAVAADSYEAKDFVSPECSKAAIPDLSLMTCRKSDFQRDGENTITKSFLLD